MSKMNSKLFLSFGWQLIIITLPLWEQVYASVGDSSPFFNRCVKDCNIEKCERGTSSFDYNILGFDISFWSCKENCEYLCQWKTVDAFKKKNWKIPQFKGKWPFIRLCGLQEPASVFFSIFNFFVVLKMFLLFKKNVPKSSPYYYVWHFYTGVSLNCWIWSSIYHSRDNDFTERMDYMSAYLMVISSFYTMGLRHISNVLNLKTLLWTIFCGILAVNHLSYLCFYYFDYEYNMRLNIIVGGSTVFGWFLWTCMNFPTQYYSWKASAYAVLAAMSTMLELIDFPPIFWVIDAHALWHFSTIFINIIFYSFLIDDCNHLNEVKNEKLEPKSKVK